MTSKNIIFIVAGAVFILLIAAWIGRLRHANLPVDDSRYFQEQQQGWQPQRSDGYSTWSDRTPAEQEQRLQRLVREHVARLRSQAEQYDAISETLRPGYLDDLLAKRSERRAHWRLRRAAVDGGPTAQELLDEKLAELDPVEQEMVRVFREKLAERREAQRLQPDAD